MTMGRRPGRWRGPGRIEMGVSIMIRMTNAAVVHHPDGSVPHLTRGRLPQLKRNSDIFFIKTIPSIIPSATSLLEKGWGCTLDPASRPDGRDCWSYPLQGGSHGRRKLRSEPRSQ